MHLIKPAVLLLSAALFFAVPAMAQKEANWTKEQLMEPSVLNEVILQGKQVPFIFSIGPGSNIPHSVPIGMTNNNANLEKLKNLLQPLAKDAHIVLYCGCCPFEHCPNVRPAISLLQQMKFTNYKLLNLPSNLKKDWIDKGFVVE